MSGHTPWSQINHKRDTEHAIDHTALEEVAGIVINGLTRMAERALCTGAEHQLKNNRAPQLYLHRSETEGPFAVLVDIDHWREILELIPEGEKITALVMNHQHLGADA